MNTANDAWAAALLADDSDATLLVWADWLEDQGDPACEGVREFLVRESLRPQREMRGFFEAVTVFSWSRDVVGDVRLRQATNHGADVVNYANMHNNAEAHYRALHDVARGYAEFRLRRPPGSFSH